MLGIQTVGSRFTVHSINVNSNLDQNPNLLIWDKQRQSLLRLRAWFMDRNRSRTALIVLPTGTGKSGIAALIPYVCNSSRVLIITPSEIITKQLIRDFGSGNGPSFYEERRLISTAEASEFVEPGIAQIRSVGAETIQSFRRVNLVIANAHKFGPHSNVDLATIPRDLFDTVIVDEAHHYPAHTWKQIIDHFEQSARRIFLTATPQHRGGPIFDDVKTLDEQDRKYTAFKATRDECVADGIIRRLHWTEVGTLADTDQQRMATTVREIEEVLDRHDGEQPDVKHQAMILTHQITEANEIMTIYNALFPNKAVTHAGTGTSSHFNEFIAGKRRAVVVCGKALEGFNQPSVSVCCILRNVAPTSRVLFAQFVGRCVRKTSVNDTVVAEVISHIKHKQKGNYDQLDQLAEDDPEDDQ